MARKKAIPVEEENTGMEARSLPEAEAVTEGNGVLEEASDPLPGAENPADGLPKDLGEMGDALEGLPGEEAGHPVAGSAEDLPPDKTGDEETAPGDLPDPPQENGEAAESAAGEMPEDLPVGETPPEAAASSEAAAGAGRKTGTEVVPQEEAAPLPEARAVPGAENIAPESAPAEVLSPKSDRQSFYDLDFNELDRDLTAEERQEWNSIYASYRGRSALTGTIIGVDPHSISVRNQETGQMERQTMYCAIVIPYRVRVVIPASEMWEAGHERPDFVLQNMVGAAIDFIIIKVDRESGFAIGSRRLAARSQRYFFAHRPALCREGARLKCRLLSVGPRRCLVECYGHDIGMTQRDLRYTAIPDLRDEYRPGQKLDCVVKGYDPERETLRISVKETESNPFEGAEFRHPAGSRRQAVIAGKYGGGVFCNLPDGTVCMCNYSYQHEDSDFLVGDTVILVVQRHEREKRQMYGKILSKW